MTFRKHLRLKEFDYSQENYYFVTICTDYRRKLFIPKVPRKYREISVVRTTSPLEVDEQKKENTNEVEKVLLDFSLYYSNLDIDFYVIMSDHIHIIFAFEGKILLKQKPTTSRHYTLGDIVGIFKQVVTKRLHKLNITGNIFQPNFYEHIIRSEHSLDKIRQYILNNPMIEYQQISWSYLDPKPL